MHPVDFSIRVYGSDVAVALVLDRLKMRYWSVLYAAWLSGGGMVTTWKWTCFHVRCRYMMTFEVFVFLLLQFLLAHMDKVAGSQRVFMS